MKDDTEELPKSPFPHWLGFFLLNPWRKIVVPRETFVKKSGISAGKNVLELGSGPGFYTEFIAKVVAKKGVVYAQDVQPLMLEQLKKRVKKFRVNKNIKPLLASSSKIPLPDKSIDVVFAANVFEEIERENLVGETAKEIKRLLKKGGHIIIIEHRHGVTKARFGKVLKILQNASLKIIRQKTTLFMHFVWLE